MSMTSEHQTLQSWFEALVEHKAVALRNCPFCKNPGPEISLGSFAFHSVTIQCQSCGAVGPYSDVYTADGYVRKLEDEVAEDRRIVKLNFENSVRCWNGEKGRKHKDKIKDGMSKDMYDTFKFKETQIFLKKMRSCCDPAKGHFDTLAGYIKEDLCMTLNLSSHKDLIEVSIDEYVLYVTLNLFGKDHHRIFRLRAKNYQKDQFRKIIIVESRRHFQNAQLEIKRTADYAFLSWESWTP